MTTNPSDEQLGRLKKLSESIFGEPAEVEFAEAEALLEAAGIDPEKLKQNLYQRMLERSKAYSNSGQPVPPLLKQALEDLQPSPTE